MLNTRKIEELKSILIQQVKNSCDLSDVTEATWGKIVGVGFKPYWTNSTDSKINKIEINYIDHQGMLRSFNMINVIGYEVLSFSGENPVDSDDVDIELYVYNPHKFNSSEPYDKVYLAMRNPKK